MRLVFLFVFAISICACSSLSVLNVKKDTKIKKEGVFYYLPKNLIVLDVAIKETRFLKGPFSSYSSKFAGIENYIAESRNEYALQDIKCSIQAIPDTSKLFFISTTGLKSKQNICLNIDQQGNIISLNFDSIVRENKNSENGYYNSSTIPHNSNIEGFEYFAVGNTQVLTDTIIEKIIIDTVMVEKHVLEQKIVEKSLEDKARDAADFLNLIAQNKMKMISGYQEVNYDVATLKYMIAELDKQIEEYSQLFTGKTVSQIRYYRFVIDPIAQETNKYIFSLSNLSVVADIEDSINTANNYYYSIKANDESLKLPIANKKSAKKNGLAYTVPIECSFTVFNGYKKLVLSEKVLISQFGALVYLPTDINKVEFYQKSGAIKRISK